MADGCGSEWRLFFADLEGLLCDYERNKSTNDVAVKESLSIRLESAVNALQSVSPYVSETNRSAIFEINKEFPVNVLGTASVAVNFAVEQGAHKSRFCH